MKQLWQEIILISLGLFYLIRESKAMSLYKASGSTTNNGNITDFMGDVCRHVNETCFSEYCDKTVNLDHLQAVQHHMRPDVDPCVDFYQYACGNWHKVHPNLSNSMDLGDRRLTERYESIFENEHPLSSSSSILKLKETLVYQKMKQYYTVCKETFIKDSINLNGYYEQISKFPLWYPENFTWLQAISYLTQYGFNTPFIKASIMRQNASSFRIFIEPSPKRNYHDPQENIAHLTDEIYQFLKKYTKKSYPELLKNFIELENDLDKKVNEFTTDDDEWLSFAELEEKLPEIDWQSFLSTIMNRKIQANDKLNVESLGLIKVLAEYANQADTELLSLYTLTRFLNFIERQPRLPVQPGKASHQCIRHMRKVLYVPMLFIYDEAFYRSIRPTSDAIILDIFQSLKDEFARTLKLNKMHFNQNILNYLNKKIESLRINIGNLPLNVSYQFYEEYVSNLHVNGNFYENHLLVLEHFTMKQVLLVDIDENDSKNPWQSFNNHSPLMIDNVDATPYYFIIQNIIIIPFAYLQVPFYDERFWLPFIYGDLANTLGHELLHSFDNRYLDYDYFGNYRTDIHNQMKNNTYYAANLQCLNQTSPKFLHERIADISGTRLALNTFMKDANFRLTNGKLYFLQFAQFFCGQDDAEDPTHDPYNLRLNHTLSQMPEFAEIFQCSPKSPMNPNQRCHHW